MIDRRSLLAMFGRGAVIAPMVGSAPLVTAAVRLIEPAKIEIIQASEADMPRDLWTHRLDQNPFERLWLARWRKEEANYRVLEHLVGREPTSDERATVAALMQWFGTNCGMGFLHETFRTEGYYLGTVSNENTHALSDIYHLRNNTWPEFVQLRMRGGPPELL